MTPDTFPPVPCTPSPLQLARFSAATWNFHRIHLDPVAASEDGLPGPVVQSTLFAELAWQAVRHWLTASDPRLVSVQWRNLRPVTAGQTITWTCTNVAAAGQPPDELITIRLAAVCPDGQAAVDASVTVRTSATRH